MSLASLASFLQICRMMLEFVTSKFWLEINAIFGARPPVRFGEAGLTGTKNKKKSSLTDKSWDLDDA